MSQRKEIVLKVEDPDPSHVGRNIVTLDREAKQALGVTSGDIIEIEATKKTGAVIWPARTEDEGKGIIRMDSFIRHNAGVGLGERATVRKADFKEAKRVVLAPTQEVRIIASGYDRILKKSFLGRPLSRGDNVWISVFGSGFVYRVIDSTPSGIVKVTDFTQFVLKEKPVKGELEGIPRVAYEDIGGLEEQIQKVRELIELPLRHPELFRKLGIIPPKGVLLYGPPGCGKTLLAKAVANETQAHFISINAPQVMCVGKETPILTNPNGTEIVEELFNKSLGNGKIINSGRMQILELKKPIGTYSLNKNLKIVKGKITHITKLKAKALKIKTSFNDEILVSKNQPFAALDSLGNLVWKTAKELKKGDIVAVAMNLAGLTERLISKKDPIMQEGLRKIQEILKNHASKLKQVPNSDIALVSVEGVLEEGEQDLFDLTVEPFNNFVGGSNLLLLHNSKFVGEAEERIRELFKEAEENAPSIIFIDELDAIAPKREEVIGEVERRVVAQLLALMDGLEARGNVIIIAATNRVNSLDEALRRPGRFDREIEFGVPDKKSREQILLIHTRGMPLAKDVEPDDFAAITHGFVSADLSALAKEAAMKALRRYLPKINLEEETIPPEILESLEVNKKDFYNALKDVQPSALREVTIEIPSVKWSDIGGLDGVKEELKQAVEWPLRHPESFKGMGIDPPSGILLYGPPGCGKTLLAKAVATESEANFISIKGPELLSMFVGESLPFDEELLVFDGKNIFREKIGNIVEKKLALKVVTFDSDGKILFSDIEDYIKHRLNGKIFEITTKTGRKIRVTDKHSLFSLSEGEIQSVAVKDLMAGKSVIAVPAKIPNISLDETVINLFNHFKDSDKFVVSNTRDAIEYSVEKFGMKETARTINVSVKYLYDIICRNLPITARQFVLLIAKSGFTPDFSAMTIGVKGARNHMPVLLNLDSGFFRLLGQFVAGGEYNRRIVRINAFNDEIRGDIVQILHKMGLTSLTLTEASIVVNSYVFKEVLEKVFGLKTGAFNKRAPAVLFTCDNSRVQNFLKGYFSGDGTIHGNSKEKYAYKHIIEASTVSRELANDLMYLLLKLGIVASCKEKLEWNGSISYRVQIFGVNNFRKFLQIGFIDKKRDNLVWGYVEGVKWPGSNKIPLNDKIQEILEQAFGSNYPRNQTVGTRKIGEALQVVDVQKTAFVDLWRLVEADIYWDMIAEIKEIEYNGFVYDVSVSPCQNFLAGFGGIFAHNSERGIRKVFRKARQVSPVIVFFDEIDSIATRRGSGVFDSGVGNRVIDQLLTELDGIEPLKNVVFICATNRPDLVDPSLLRPGRIDKLIKVDAPDEKTRLAVLKVHTKNVPLARDVSLEQLAKKTQGFSGADLEGLVREAALLTLKQNKMKPTPIENRFFEEVLKRVGPTITEEVEDAYEEFREHVGEFKPSYVE